MLLYYINKQNSFLRSYHFVFQMPAKSYNPNKYAKKASTYVPRYAKASRPRYARSAAAKPSQSQVNSAVNALVKTAGGAVGNMIAPGVGGIIGSGLADGAHRMFKQITGFGDYEVNNNSLMVDSVPQFANSNRSVRVKHREYIGDVISGAAGTFSIKEYPINPGLPSTFPWLSNMASQYEEYKIKGMIFEFKTMSSDALNSTNTALGQVIMATQYNVLSNPFVTKQQMENYQFACSTKPSTSLIHPVECEPHETPMPELFVRGFNQSTTGADARLYDFGNFYVATNGLQGANVNLGELWCSYEIELFKPKIGTIIQMTDHYQLQSGLIPTGGNYFGSAPVLSSSSNFRTEVTSNSITIPDWYTGQFLIMYSCYGTANAVSQVAFSPDSRGTALNLFNLNSGNGMFAANSSTPTYYIWATFSCVGGCKITLTGGTLPTSVTNGDLVVTTIAAIN